MALIRSLKDLNSESYTLQTADGPVVITIKWQRKKLHIEAPKSVRIDRGEKREKAA